ncbi:MAG TPA: hypothetical protein DCS15_08960 [Flavobacteriales bacterium]|jgi:hypothetical protein|nr:hypothetical protein [Salibacteraceae bacterium]HAS36604.1 hypothetical protein [Flavobacteriales bacterium]
MKKFLLFIFCLMILDSASAHPLYVSITQIEFNQQKKRLEVSIKVFQDDLLKALKAERASILEPCGEGEGIQNLLEEYLKKNFDVVVKEKHLKIDFLGSKCEDDDIIYLFVSLDLKNAPEELFVKNSILFDQLESQENIVHINIGEKKRSLLLNLQRPEASARFD